MKFGPKFNKMFTAYPDMDKKKIKHNRIIHLTREEVFYILKIMKKAGIDTPAQPTRTSTAELKLFLLNELNKLGA